MSKDKMPDKVTIMLNTVVGYYQVSDVPDKWKENFREGKGVGFVDDYIKKSEAVSKADIQALVDLWKPYVREGLYSGELIDSIEKLLEGKDNE